MMLGWKLYGIVDDAVFRKAILILLLLSGIALIVPQAFAVLHSPSDEAR